MLHTGLVSITFRQYSPKEIINLVCDAKLESIEWGGDIHVPHGNNNIAREVSTRTLGSGLLVSAYGSYYRAGSEDSNLDNFKRVLETAVNLKAPTIRVWAGEKHSREVDNDYFQKVVEHSRLIADLAQTANISISFEFHNHTLTDTNESSYKLLSSINHDNVKTFWQPNQYMSLKERMDGLIKIEKWLTNIHVFNWDLDDNGYEFRKTLAEGSNEWDTYIKFGVKRKWDSFAMIEFVKDDCPKQFIKDAEVLKLLINQNN